MCQAIVSLIGIRYPRSEHGNKELGASRANITNLTSLVGQCGQEKTGTSSRFDTRWGKGWGGVAVGIPSFSTNYPKEGPEREGEVRKESLQRRNCVRTNQ